MSLKSILFFISLFFFCVFNFAYASVVINEVQVGSEDNASNEFIELYNTESFEVDLSGFSIYKKTSSGSESTIVAKSRFDGVKIPSLGFLFLAREGGYIGSRTPDIFWPNSYSIASNNSLILYEDFSNNIIEDQVSWGDVQVFKRVNTNTETNTNTEVSTNQTNNTNETIKTVDNKKPNLKIVNKNSGFVGIPLEFEAQIENAYYQNMYGKYVWNFGDGSAMEVKGIDNRKFTHTYHYAGDYLVNVEYFNDYQQPVPDYSAKINIKIVPATIVISNVGDESDFFIELMNNSPLDIDISNWILLGNNKSFIFPKNTLLLSSKKIILSPMITNFNYLDKATLRLVNKEYKIIFDYGASLIPKVATTSSQKINKTSSISTSTSVATVANQNNFTNISEETVENIEDIYFDTSNLGEVAGLQIEENNYLYFLFLILIITFGIASVYFIRKRKITKEEGVDFDILDE